MIGSFDRLGFERHSEFPAGGPFIPTPDRRLLVLARGLLMGAASIRVAFGVRAHPVTTHQRR